MEQARSSSLSSARRRPFKPDPCLVSPAYNRQSMVQKLIVTDEEDRASYVKVKRGTTVRQLRESLQKVDGPLSTSPTGAMSDPNAYVFLNGGVSVADEGRITVAAILPKLSLASARPHSGLRRGNTDRPRVNQQYECFRTGGEQRLCVKSTRLYQPALVTTEQLGAQTARSFAPDRVPCIDEPAASPTSVNPVRREWVGFSGYSLDWRYYCFEVKNQPPPLVVEVKRLSGRPNDLVFLEVDARVTTQEAGCAGLPNADEPGLRTIVPSDTSDAPAGKGVNTHYSASGDGSCSVTIKQPLQCKYFIAVSAKHGGNFSLRVSTGRWTGPKQCCLVENRGWWLDNKLGADFAGEVKGSTPHSGNGVWVSTPRDLDAEGGGEQAGDGKFVGEWRNRMPFTGAGTWLVDAHITIVGEWNEGAGRGSMETAVNTSLSYEGSFQGPKKHGEGTLECDYRGRTARWHGMWQDDLPWDGAGDWVDPEHNLVAGKWNEGMGLCTVHYADLNDEFYDGEVLLERQPGCYAIIRTGTGIMRWPACESSYSGKWSGDERQGHGVYQCPHGVGEGEWDADTLHGHAEFTLSSTGDRFSGNWTRSKVDLDSPSGTWTGPGDDVYLGQWKAGLMHGQGAYTSTAPLAEGAADGKFRFFGEWRDGKQWCGLASWIQIIGHAGREPLEMKVQASIRDGVVQSITPAKKLPVWADDSELKVPTRQWPAFNLTSIGQI